MVRDQLATESMPLVVIGLMSGTSSDGIDAAIVKTDGESSFEFIAAETFPYDGVLRSQLLHIAQSQATIDEILHVERLLTLAHVVACQQLQEKTKVRASLVGFHGHTIRHIPLRQESGVGTTCQIGDPNFLSEHIGCPVVSDFRRRDIAAGGEGAPLVPLFHQEMLRSIEKPTSVLNIGGVANLTWLGPGSSILAGDTGPGCGLLDAWVLERTGQPFDKDAKLAAQGQAHHELVEQFIDQPFFQQPLPKSADRFQFQFGGLEDLSTEDGAATLSAATVAAVEQTIQQLPVPPKSLFATGGGARNPRIISTLLDRLNERWDCDVSTVESLGLRSESMEAECFAWLAVRRLRGLHTTLPQTTGCSYPVCGGQITW